VSECAFIDEVVCTQAYAHLRNIHKGEKPNVDLKKHGLKLWL